MPKTLKRTRSRSATPKPRRIPITASPAESVDSDRTRAKPRHVEGAELPFAICKELDLPRDGTGSWSWVGLYSWSGEEIRLAEGVIRSGLKLRILVSPAEVVDAASKIAQSLCVPVVTCYDADAEQLIVWWSNLVAERMQEASRNQCEECLACGG